jgi:hypothetical protein
MDDINSPLKNPTPLKVQRVKTLSLSLSLSLSAISHLEMNSTMA